MKPIHLVFFVLLIVGALFVRVYDLGDFGFWTDELYHAIGARSIVEEGRPVFPSGREYTRALGFTHIVACFMKCFGESEFVARLPAVIADGVFLTLSTVYFARSFSWPVALLYLLAASFSPFSIVLARQCRMYTFFQLLYFLSTMLFFEAFEPKRGTSRYTVFGVSVPLMLVSFFLFALSFHFHPLTVTFSFVFGVYILVMMVYDGIIGRNENAASGVSKYVIAFVLGGLFFLALTYIVPHKLTQLVFGASELPPWAKYKAFSIHTYRYMLGNAYPFIFYSFPFGAYAIIRRYGRRGLFWVLSFLVLIIPHSLIFPLKRERYIHYFLPWFYISGAYCLSLLYSRGFNGIQRLFSKQPLVCKIMAIIALTVCCGFLFCMPWVSKTLQLYAEPHAIDWKSSQVEVAELVADATVLISTEQNPIYYYFERVPDFYLRASYYDNEGDTEHLCASTPITSAEELRSIYETGSSVTLVTSSNRMRQLDYIDAKMKRFIESSFSLVRDIPSNKYLSIQVYEKK